MKAAPYNPSTLARIRAGATAPDLGWDQQFYLTVCRRHEIEPVAVARPTLVAPSSPAASIAAKTDEDEDLLPLAFADDIPRFDPAARRIYRRNKFAALNGRQAKVLDLLVAANDCVSSTEMAQRHGIDSNNIGAVINSLRTKLKRLRMWVRGEMRRGYRLVDDKNIPIKMLVVPARDIADRAP